VSKVENMQDMFYYAAAFDQPLESWNISKVENMRDMLRGAQAFNQPLSWGRAAGLTRANNCCIIM